MSPPVDPVAPDPTLPERTDVVIIGGGIIGVCTALFLAEKGIAVVLCEKGRIGGEQSSRNWGWCRTMGRDVGGNPAGAGKPAAVARHEPAHRPRDRLPPAWHHVSVRDRARDRGIRKPGWSRPAQYQVDARLLRGVALDAVMPGAAQLRRRPAHATDGRAEPAQAAPAIAEAARDARRADPDQLRGARHRAARRTGRAAWSPRRAGSPAIRWCWPGAPGRGCSAGNAGSTCRN